MYSHLMDEMDLMDKMDVMDKNRGLLYSLFFLPRCHVFHLSFAFSSTSCGAFRLLNQPTDGTRIQPRPQHLVGEVCVPFADPLGRGADGNELMRQRA